MAWADSIADALEDNGARYKSPGHLATSLYPQTVQTPALQLLDKHLVKVAEGDTRRLMWFMPPQEGKSQRVSRWFPLWMLMRDPELRIVIASYEFNAARRWGRAIRDEIKMHPELGLQVKASTGAANEWELEGHAGGVYCVGVGGPLTGRPADLIIIDDPVKGREEADSEHFRERAKDWWKETVNARMSETTPVVLIMTRWHEDDLAGFLQTEHPDEWVVINIPALAEGDHDPLGRSDGEWLKSARHRSKPGWEQRRANFGTRGFQALCQGRPSPDEGNIFKRQWWQRYSDPPVRFDVVMMSWDMTFKDTRGSDYVVGQVWGKKGADAYLLDQVRGQWDFPATCNAVTRMAAKWPEAHAKLVEDKANGPAVLAQLRHQIPGLVPFTPRESKMARASAISPYVESGNVYVPRHKGWADQFIDECSQFPNGSHDDMVDAMSQALTRLLLVRTSRGPRLHFTLIQGAG